MRIIKLKHFFFEKFEKPATFSLFYFMVKLVSYSKRKEYFTILGLEKHGGIFLDANDANWQGPICKRKNSKKVMTLWTTQWTRSLQRTLVLSRVSVYYQNAMT